MAYWLLLVLGMVAFGIGIFWLFAGNYAASTAVFLLAIILILLAIATRKDRHEESNR